MNRRSPVLFLIFNRPETTSRVFDAIRRARPPRLYIAADGPRESRPSEAELCARARQIATDVDWPCEVRKLFHNNNLGCKKAVSTAVTWFFDEEPEGIVLEDDCLPHPTFFRYCDELLDRYRDQPEIMCISGVNFISASWTPDASYYFSRYSHIWGWASWRRAWKHYDVDMASWRVHQSSGVLDRLFPAQPQVRRHWSWIFDQVSAGRIDTWDYQWMFACFEKSGLSCLPRVNLISNIGFGKDATHTVSAESKMANLSVETLEFPLQHPIRIGPTVSADDWTNTHVFDIDASFLGLTRWRRRAAARLHQLRSGGRP